MPNEKDKPLRKITMRIGLGVLIWLAPFLLGMALFQIVPPESALFDTIMGLSLTAAATGASLFYLTTRPEERQSLRRLCTLGGLWAALAVLLDAPIFLMSDFSRMSTYEYFSDIGLSYAIIPIVLIGMGSAMNRVA